MAPPPGSPTAPLQPLAGPLPRLDCGGQGPAWEREASEPLAADIVCSTLHAQAARDRWVIKGGK